MSGDFESLLDIAADEIKEPGLYPVGTWLLRCVGVVIKDDGDKPMVMFAYVGREPGEDVDPDELAKANFEGGRIWVRRYLETQRDAFELKKFIALHGVDTSGRSLREAARDCRGTDVYAYVGTRSYEDKQSGDTKVENTAKQFAPVDEALAA